MGRHGEELKIIDYWTVLVISRCIFAADPKKILNRSNQTVRVYSRSGVSFFNRRILFTAIYVEVLRHPTRSESLQYDYYAGRLLHRSL